MKHNKGFSSLEFIITLFFLCVILIALGIFLRMADLSVKKRTEGKKDKELIDGILNTVFSEIKKDSTPAVDSRFDPVWKLNDTDIDGFHITIKSLSGLINLNFINKDILVKTNLKAAFNSPEVISTIKDKINNEGLLFSYKQIEDSISEEKFNEFFTFYGYANFNVADDDALKLFANSLSGSYFGDELINKRKSLRHNKQFIQNDTEFNLLCGIHYSDIFPFINLYPTMNVNFLSEECLKALLSFQNFKLAGANQKVNNLISLRDSKEVSQEELCSLLGITKNSELYYYLGCKTWMWQILVEGKTTSCNVILARDPEENALGDAKIYLIEKRWN